MPKPAPPGIIAWPGENGKTLYARCLNCNHFAIVQPYKLAQRCGWRATYKEAAKYVYCNMCKSRDCELTTERPRHGRDVCPRCLRPYRTR